MSFTFQVQCEKDLMRVRVVFDRPFYGMIFSKGHYSNINCVHVPSGLGQTQVKRRREKVSSTVKGNEISSYVTRENVRVIKRILCILPVDIYESVFGTKPPFLLDFSVIKAGLFNRINC